MMCAMAVAVACAIVGGGSVSIDIRVDGVSLDPHALI